MAKFCSNCGAQLEAGQRFCDRCGVQVADYNSNSFQGSHFSPPQVNSPPKIVVNIQNTNQGYGIAPPIARPLVSQKSKTTVILLWLFGGFLGLHYFYVGKVFIGLIYLCTGGIFGLGWLLDACKIFGNTFRDTFGLPVVND